MSDQTWLDGAGLADFDGQLQDTLLKTLRVLRKLESPQPCRKIAKLLGISPQATACRIFRLRTLRMAIKLGVERYDISRNGIDFLSPLDSAAPEGKCSAD